jgi:hypothetical protein
MTLYVSNLPTGTTPADLAALFGVYGWVGSASVGPPDPAADSPGGCGYVEFEYGGWGTAVVALNGSQYRGRKLAVRAVLPWGRATPDRV